MNNASELEPNISNESSSMTPVVAAIVFDERGRVLLAQRAENDNHPLKWEFPGGKLRTGESPEDCVRREVLEEMGIHVEVTDVFHVVNHSYADRDILLMAYTCKWTGAEEVSTNVHKRYGWVRPDDISSYDMLQADWPIIDKLIKG